MTLHYHGTPITPRSTLLQLAGRCFCVSWARPDDVQVCHEIGQSVMLDNGAYTFWRQRIEGRRPTAKAEASGHGRWDEYYAWAAPWLRAHTTWAVIPDVIDGSVADNDALVAEWPFGYSGAPVWHMHEPLGRLARLCGDWPRVCLGSSGAYSRVGDARWHRRLGEAMAVVCDGEGVPRAWLHMLRGLALATGPYPFASLDSTNIAQNHAGNNGGRARRSPVAMATEIDGRQCPASWQSPMPQLALRIREET